MRYVKWLLVILLVSPVLAFVFYKPVRVLLPETFGVTCSENNICIDDVTQLNTAAILLNSAKEYLETQQKLSIGEPKVIFCSTKKCQTTFGLSKRAGLTIGIFGIVIGPRGWKQHIVAHELIHYWQAENFGSLVLLNGESWLIEGMAYALSNDPREKLEEPFESYRQRFNNWRRLNVSVPLKISFGEAL